jgi:tRNA A37 threonylcarbamoyladenosine dehydratase
MFDILNELIEDVKDAEKSSDVESGDAFHLRQTEAPWAAAIRKYEMTIVGAGNIGSWLALYAARSRAGVTIMDMDTVEAHNIGGQFFKKADIGKNKAVAVAANIAMFNDKGITTKDYAMTPKSGEKIMRYTKIVCSFYSF